MKTYKQFLLEREITVSKCRYCGEIFRDFHDTCNDNCPVCGGETDHRDKKDHMRHWATDIKIKIPDYNYEDD